MAVPVFELLVAFTLVLVYFVIFRKKKHPNYPPGPPALPLIGNIHQLGNRPYVSMTKWKYEYGDIFSMKLGLEDAIVINDAKLLKEIYGDAGSSGRIQNPIFLSFSEGAYGVINTEGEVWEEQRRFVLRKLRDFGFAKTSMEGMILEEANAIINWFTDNNGVPVSVDRVFNSAVVNSLWSIVSGERSEWMSKDGSPAPIIVASKNLISATNEACKTGIMFAPFLRFIFPEMSGWNKLKAACKFLNKINEDTLQRHKSKLDPNCPQDLVDHFLIEIEKTKEPKSGFYKENGIKNLKAVVLDLFEAGNETTSSTLSWMLLYLSHHPIAQQRLIDEIQSVVGKSRLPSLSDKVSLPYTEAVILEVLRYSALVPMGVIHRMLTDKMYRGFYFPKHTLVIANLYSVLHDPKNWGDPENFRPERFLSEDGTKVIRNENHIPFSIGRRICLGESLAKDTLFLFTASIFQKFEVLPDPDNPKHNFEAEDGFIRLPPAFRIVMKKLS